MTIWVDADACPKDVKEIVYRASERVKVRAVLVANQGLTVPRSEWISTVRVGAGLDVADTHIAKAAAKGDLAITADIPLAAILVERGLTVIDIRGEQYDEDNVRERLAMRDLMKELRDSGVPTSGPKSFGPKDRQRFAATLDRLLALKR